MLVKLLPLLTLFLLPLSSPGQTLLKDIEDLTGSTGSSPRNWSSATEDLFVFQADNLVDGQTLFASDGTEAGTVGLGTFQIDTDIVRLGDRAYFGGCNPFLGADSCAALYRTNGTPDGTEFFFDLTPGTVSLGIEDIVAGDSLLFFSGHTNETGFELWRSNGTPAGTYRIAEIAPGPESGYAGELAVIDDIAYFAGFTPAAGIEPWRSDGTAEGTYLITDLNAGTADGFPSGFTASGGFVYFSGLGTGTGFEVRRTNGAAGNIELIGEMSTTDSSRPRDFVDSDGRLFYVAEGNDVAGFDLFVYDHVGQPLHLELAEGDIFPRALLPFGEGEVIFNAENESAGRELWRSDGTVAGTRMILDLYPGETDGVFGTGAPGESFFVWNDSLMYFAGADGIHAAGEFTFELFVSDGTAAGTRLYSDQFPGTEGTNPGNFLAFGERLYFAATDPDVGREPFYLDLGTVSTIPRTAGIAIPQAPFPNPIASGRPLTTSVDLPVGTTLYVALYDFRGRLVQGKTKVGRFPAGTHELSIPIGHHPSGVYQLVLTGANAGQASVRVIVE